MGFAQQNHFTFDLSLYLDRTLAQRRAQQKVKLTQCLDLKYPHITLDPRPFNPIDAICVLHQMTNNSHRIRLKFVTKRQLHISE